MMALIKKNIIIAVIFVVAAGILYYFYAKEDTAPLLSTEEQAPVSQEILTTLGNLRTIRLDSSVFADPLFISLSDFGVTIPPAAAGRRNPFAPVGAGGGTVTTPAATTTKPAATTTPAR